MKSMGGSKDFFDSVTKVWIHQWQERYGVLKSDRSDSADVLNTSDDGSDLLDSSGSENSIFDEFEKRTTKISSKIEGNHTEMDVKKENIHLISNERGIHEDDTNEELVPESEETGHEENVPRSIEPVYRANNDKTSYGSLQYLNDQIYFAFCFHLNWKSVPDKNMEDKNNDSVWLLMAANRSGRHRMRILVTGRQWRPSCLKHVNLMSQPVIYAGGGNGNFCPDLFSWWFRKEFVPAANSLNSEYVLLAEDKWFSSKLKDQTDRTNIRLIPVSEKDASDWDLIYSEFKARYTILFLRSLADTFEMTSARSVTDYLKGFNLKKAFPLFHKSWLNIRFESFQRLTPNPEFFFKEGQELHDPVEVVRFAKENGLKNGEEFETINLTIGGIGKKMDGKESGRLALTRRLDVSSIYAQQDEILLLELKWLAQDLGLSVTDDDYLTSWVLDRTPSTTIATVKTESSDIDEIKEILPLPTAKEAVDCLNKALTWMETQPIDSNLLMTVRDVIDIAKQASKMGLAPPHPGAALPFFCHNGDHLTQPPPAHMGIPPYQLDAKGAGAMGLSRTPMYPFSAGSAYPYPMLSPEMSQVPTSWHTPGMYPISAGAGFRSPYPTSLPISSTTLPSDFYRFSPTSLLPGHPGLSPHGHHSLSSHPAIVTPGPKQELGHHVQSDHNHRSSSLDHKNSSSSHHGRQESKTQDSGSQNDKKKPHIKKPLNAFMLYMKEMRAKVVAECTLKESAAINQILGRRWHALGREEQAKYYELARRERQLHMQLYPDWSSRANSSRGKKRKRKQEANDGGNNMKKCRARYGLDQQSQWCKPCRRKKKCIRYLESGEERDGNQSEDNLGSCGSVGEARTPPDDDDGAESLPHSLSSPGGLSGLSSLTSPSMILPSPSTSLASPSVSLASPCMSLQSPLTPPTFDMKPIMPIALPPLNRNPVGTNPHDVNNPLSVNQLTGKCIKSEPKEQSRPISVT